MKNENFGYFLYNYKYGLYYQSSWPAVTEKNVILIFGSLDQIVAADVAWMLTSCCLVNHDPD
jgi:hypothetical protein